MRYLRTLFGWAVVLCFISIGGGPIFAQLPTGTILGVVKDASGSVVPGSTVTVRNLDTDQVRSVMTDNDGAYRVPALSVGHYEVSAEHAGFKSEVQTGLTLEVTQEAVISFVLQVGTTQQEVRVTGEAPVVNTTSSALGGLVNEEKMQDLPLNGRNYVSLALLQPGVMEDKAISYEGASAGTVFSSNGATPTSNYFMLDGAPLMNAMSLGSGSSAGSTLGVDGIQEFKVLTTGVDAEYGMAMGAQVVMVSKGGTNQFHGDAFEYIRNSIFDARNFFDYGYQLPGAPRLPHLSRNDFGGSFGGPIKKDKTFFYGVYEGLRQEQGITTVDSVPAAGCHGLAGAVVWNGSGTQPAGSIGPCTQLGANPSGTGTNTVTILPAVAPLLALYPVPNLPGNEFTFPSTNPTIVNYGQIRVDHSFSPSDAMFVRYTIDNSYLATTNVQNATASNGPGYPGFQLAYPGRDQFLTVSENHIFSSELLNTARISVSRNTTNKSNLTPNGDPIGPQYSFVAGDPMGSIAIGSVSGPYGINTSVPSYNYQTVFTISDDVFYTRGHHALKFGTLLHRQYDPLANVVNTDGQVSFPSIANFLRGINSTYSRLTPGSYTTRYFALDTVGFYVQDDWRALPRLTLNLGFRYEFMTTPVELHGFQGALRNIATDATGTIGPIMDNPSYHNFAPRVGFAYDVTGKGKTSLRGAFGIYYDVGNLGTSFNEGLNGTPPFSAQDSVQNTPTPITLPFTFPASDIGHFLQMVDYDARQPHMLEYNLTGEQQLPFDIGLSISYVGMRGIDLWTKGEGNPTIPTSITNGVSFWGPNIPACSGVVPSCRRNPNWLSMALDSNFGNSWYNALQVNVVKRLARGLEFQGAYTWGQNLDDTENQAGNSSGVSGCEFADDPTNRRLSRGPSCFDVTNNAHVNLIYYFPKANVSNSFVSKLANGWWVGNIVSLQSGYPFTPVLSTQRSRSGVNAGQSSQVDRVNVNTAASIAATFPSTCTSLPGQPAAGANPCLYTPIPFNASTVTSGNFGNFTHWFNPAMFSLGPVGYLGDGGRNILRGPGLTEWDFSIVKDTALRFPTENASIQFRAEFFNITNTPNFSVPSGTAFSGSTSDIGPYSESPTSNEGVIAGTSTTSRQIQFALKLIF